MKSLIETIRRSWILSVLLTIALGAVLLVYPDTTSKVLCYLVGGVLLAHGVLNLVRFFTKEEGRFFLRYELVVGVVLCAAGILMLMRPEIVVMLIPMILGIYIILDGAVNVRRALEMKELGFSKWWSALVGAILMLVLGAVMFWNPFEAAQMTLMFIGIALLYQGILDFVILFLVGRGRKKMAKMLEDMDETL